MIMVESLLITAVAGAIGLVIAVGLVALGDYHVTAYPVSYTHLDVYKRQVETSLSCDALVAPVSSHTTLSDAIHTGGAYLYLYAFVFRSLSGDLQRLVDVCLDVYKRQCRRWHKLRQVAC